MMVPFQSVDGALAQYLVRVGVPTEYAEAAGSAVTFVVALIVLHLLSRAFVLPVIDRALRARDMDVHARQPLKKLARILLVFVSIALAFGFAGYGNFLTSLATVAAAATLAIGFAMQDVLKNFVAGVFIYTERPFRIGDWIEWDGNSAVVEDISLRVTRARTFDNELLTVPNSQLTDGVVKNPVAKGTLRLKFVFGISYDDDIDEAADIIIEEAEAHEGIMDDPAPAVRLVELGDSSVGLQARIWIDDPSRSDFVKIRGEYVQAVKEHFDREDITIPFPNRTLEGGLEVTNLEGVDAATADD